MNKNHILRHKYWGKQAHHCDAQRTPKGYLCRYGRDRVKEDAIIWRTEREEFVRWTNLARGQDAGGKNGRLGSSPKPYLRYYNHFVKTKKKRIQLNARLLLKDATRNSVNRCIRDPYAWWSTYIAFRWINVRGALTQLKLADPSTRLAVRCFFCRILQSAIVRVNSICQFHQILK